MKQPKKSLFILLLLLLCVSLLAVGTYAAYTTSDYAKQVVLARTRDVGETLRFSSNLLYYYELDASVDIYDERSISVSNSGVATISISVCNYPQSDLASFNDKDISYTMSVTGPAGTSITFSPQTGKLQGGKPSSVYHEIKIPAEDLTAVSKGSLTVVVTPDNESKEATMQNKLAAKLKIIPKEAAASGWEGDLIFVGGSENNDAINFHIYGTEECDMVLSWGNNIKLGQWSRESLDVSSFTENSVTIHVGGPGQPTSYYLQFYRLAPAENNETKDTLGIEFYKVT